MTARRWRLAWPWLLLLLVAAGTAWLRYGLIEASAIGQQCAGGQGPWWCTGRQWLVLGFLHDVYGIAALIATAAALGSRRTWLAWLATALGVFALQLYCVETGALALLIGCLRLSRLQAANVGRTPGEQNRQRQQHVQTQP